MRQSRGVRRVEGRRLYTTATQPPSIADELRRQADVFVDLMELQPKIRREESTEGVRT